MKLLQSIIYVCFGGAAGAALRYLISLFFQNYTVSFPFGTLAVNLLGCFGIGIFSAIMENNALLPPHLRMLIVTGFFGAFTTMSSFIYELDKLASGGQYINAMVYGTVTLAGSFVLYCGGRISVHALVSWIIH